MILIHYDEDGTSSIQIVTREQLEAELTDAARYGPLRFASAEDIQANAFLFSGEFSGDIVIDGEVVVPEAVETAVVTTRYVV